MGPENFQDDGKREMGKAAGFTHLQQVDQHPLLYGRARVLGQAVQVSDAAIAGNRVGPRDQEDRVRPLG